MDRSERKRLTRKNLSLKARLDRFISGYIEVKHPQTYNEAKEYYEKLDSVYPNKRDLCKTVEFLYATTGVTSFTEYYRQKRLDKGKKQTEKKSIVDNMVLRIPLFDATDKNIVGNIPDQQKVNVHEESLTIPDDVYENLVQELRKDPDLYNIFNDMNTSGDDIIDLSGEQQVQLTIEQPDENIPGDDIIDLSGEQQVQLTIEQPDENIPDTVSSHIP